MNLHNKKDREGFMVALLNWVESQEVDHHEAAYLLVQMAGAFLGRFAVERNKDLEEGIDILAGTLRKSAILTARMEEDFNDSKK